ncbi:MAG: glycosyltransferase [Vicingus serpentipes]|nr:glycosyltransferase [Vicingus serpentipes]
MKILITGNYDSTYNRTRILLKGLQNNPQIELTEHPINSPKKLDKIPLKKLCDEADFIYLPPFTHESVKYIKRLTNTPIVFDPLISKYLTKVFDYKQISKYSPRAYKNYLKDKVPMQQCDLLIADTLEHKNYFSEKFKVNPNKIVVLPIGANTSDFIPSTKKETSIFKVGFYGGFIPLQGVSRIIEAAQILQNEKDIHFNLIGTGFELEKIKLLVQKKKLNNINFLGWIEYNELPSKINEFDICLGIFGDTPKADMVIPNKIYHYAALQKCIITKETQAIKEVFTDKTDIILTSNKAKTIAENILFLKDNKSVTDKIARAAHTLIQKEYNENKIAERFIDFLKKFK